MFRLLVLSTAILFLILISPIAIQAQVYCKCGISEGESCNLLVSDFTNCDDQCGEGGVNLGPAAGYSDNDCTMPLPVELVAFNARATENSVHLNWLTSSEIDNSGFELHRSVDARNWEMLHFIGGHGTTLESKQYNYIDFNSSDGLNYYRLKQIDFNGKYEYSMVVGVDFQKNEFFSEAFVFPNPASSELNIVNGEGTVKLFDVFGHILEQIVIESERFVLDVNNLPKGQYFLSLQKKDGSTTTKKFVK